MSRFTVKTFTRAEDLAAWADFWKSIQWHANADYDFYRMILRIRAQYLLSLCLMVLLDGDKPVALLAGRIERSEEQIKLGYLRLFKANTSCLHIINGGCMGEISAEAAPVVRAAVKNLLREKKLDKAELNCLDVRGALYNELRRRSTLHERLGWDAPVPHWRMKVPASLEEFLQKRSKKHRYWLNRLPKVLQKDFPGKVRTAIFQSSDEVAKFCEDAETVAKVTYQRGLGAGFFDDAEHRERLTFAAANKRFRGYILYINDQPRAFWGGTLYGSVFYLGWTGFDPQLRKYELGTVLFVQLIEDLAKAGVQEVDFGLGTASYKERFGDYNWPERSVSIYAGTVRASGLALLVGTVTAIRKIAKKTLAAAKLTDRLKKRWRNKLATNSQADETLGNATGR